YVSYICLSRVCSLSKENAILLAHSCIRARIVRQLLIEGFVLALLGGVCGLLLWLWSSDLLIASLRAIVPVDIVWLSGPNPMILGAILVFCVLGTLGFALGSALKLSLIAVLGVLLENTG